MKILMIANGPSAIKQRGGEAIDSFDGDVLRFNWYVVDGYEDYVGTRTDRWVTIDSYASLIVKQYKQVYHHDWRLIDGPTKALELIRQYHPTAQAIPVEVAEKTKELMNYNSPSTGAIATVFLMDDYDLYLYGFDHFNPKVKHHYMHTKEHGEYLRGSLHEHNVEKAFFDKLLRRGKVKCWMP